MNKEKTNEFKHLRPSILYKYNTKRMKFHKFYEEHSSILDSLDYLLLLQVAWSASIHFKENYFDNMKILKSCGINEKCIDELFAALLDFSKSLDKIFYKIDDFNKNEME